MEFLYIFSLIFLSLFGLVMLIKTAADAFLRDEKRGGVPHKDRTSDMGVGRKRR